MCACCRNMQRKPAIQRKIRCDHPFPAFGLEFQEEFQDQLMFGTDSCARSDVNRAPPNVALWRNLTENRMLPETALEKIGHSSAERLLNLQGGGFYPAV
jgi:predicted TIM-barrel fold metal-dependent hydrolase